MAAPVIQPSFAAGELSPGLFARVDLAKWHVGAALLRNFFVDARGGVSNRPGTKFIMPCYSGINRLIDFTFSTTQTYALLFSDLKLRFITNGGALLEATQAISAITRASPGVLTYVGADPANGDWMYLSGIGGMTGLNGRFVVVTNVNAVANTFQLYDTNGDAIDTSAYSAFTAGGTMARVYTIVSPYAAADLALLKYTQSADVMTFTHPSYQPRKLVRSGATSWAFSALTAAASQAPPTGVTAVESAGGGTTTYRYVVVAVTAQSVRSAPSTSGETTTAQPMSTTAAENITVTWVAAAGADYYEVYRQIEIPDSAPSTTELYGFVGSSLGTSFVDQNTTPDFSKTPQITYDPFAGSAWPGSTTYFQQRQLFAGANAGPETINMSRTQDFLNFNYSAPSQDNDGIIATIASRQVNAIKHMVPMQSLIALSSSGAWRLDAGPNGSAITPSNIQAVPQAFNGCSDVPPLTINYDILYVQQKGSVVRDLAYNFYVNVYTGADVTVMSNHLFFGHRITEWAWAEEPFKLVWAVREDGMLLSFTYLKEQDVYAWTHHDGDGLFKSVCSISEGDENAVYFVVYRLIDGNYVQYVERLASRNMAAKPDYNPPVPANLARAWFVDCGLQYPLTNPAVTLIPQSNGRAPDNIPGRPVIVYAIVDVNNIDGGSGYTAPTVTVVDAFGTGSGAQIVANQTGGVITSYGVIDPGMNYQQPQLVISDPTGSGAIAAPIISNDVVMDADGAFTATVGDMVRVNDGWGPVREVNSVTQITVNVQQPLSSVWPAASGDWSCTTPVSNVAGLDHLEGKQVAILANGNVVSDGVTPPITVTGGALSQDLPEASDAIFVGLPYVAQLKTLYADVPGQQPTVQGRRISISAATVRVQDTRGLKIGHTFDDMQQFRERDFQPMGFPILPITGDMRKIVGSQYEVDAQICIEQSNPLPATVLGFIPELQVGDTPG